MTGQSDFRSTEQEIQKLLEECTELRRTLTTISRQVGRIADRVGRAFPEIPRKTRRGDHESPSTAPLPMSRDQALTEFDRIVMLAASGANVEAERVIESKTPVALSVITRELGITFPKSKPSVRAMREAIIGKVRESVLLSRHQSRA